MSQERLHASLSASKAARWMACTPSAVFEAQFDDPGSPYAAEGTLAHSVAELAVRKATKGIAARSYNAELKKLKESEDGKTFYAQEMQDAADFYAGTIVDTLRTCADPFLVLEQKVSYEVYAPGGYGYADAVIIDDEVLYVIDFKYGKGIKVEAEANPQLRLYALGAYDAFKDFYDGIKTIKTMIIQPRLEHVSTEETSVADLTAWGTETVKPRAELAAEGKGEYVPGEHCRFCLGRGQCKARADINMQVYKSSPDVNLLSFEEAGALLEKAKDVKAWLADLEELVFRALNQGSSVPGWKIVEGRSLRKLTDPDAAAAALIADGIDEALIYERSLLTLTGLEKALGKKYIADTIGSYIDKPAGKPTLAPESDKRPAYNNAEALAKAFAEGGE